MCGLLIDVHPTNDLSFRCSLYLYCKCFVIIGDTDKQTHIRESTSVLFLRNHHIPYRNGIDKSACKSTSRKSTTLSLAIRPATFYTICSHHQINPVQQFNVINIPVQTSTKQSSKSAMFCRCFHHLL